MFRTPRKALGTGLATCLGPAIIGPGTVVGAFAIAATGVVGLRHRRIARRA